jgi:hypothetical protein
MASRTTIPNAISVPPITSIMAAIPMAGRR